jgi:hypothetical protein
MSQSQVVAQYERREYSAAEKLGAALEIRAQLAQAVKSAWSTKAGMIIRDSLSNAAYASGFASGMESIMSRVAADIKALAERTIKNAYRELWGKPTRR